MTRHERGSAALVNYSVVLEALGRIGGVGASRIGVEEENVRRVEGGEAHLEGPRAGQNLEADYNTDLPLHRWFDVSLLTHLVSFELTLSGGSALILVCKDRLWSVLTIMFCYSARA